MLSSNRIPDQFLEQIAKKGTCSIANFVCEIHSLKLPRRYLVSAIGDETDSLAGVQLDQVVSLPSLSTA